jgi:hypothetical protein
MKTKDKIELLEHMSDFQRGWVMGYSRAEHNIFEVIDKLNNPYPKDIFIGTTLEGKSGVVLNKIFEAWRESIKKEILDKDKNG